MLVIINLGWFKLKTYKHSHLDPQITISVIIPAKNEERNIADCLTDLINQSYPKNLYEIIVVDDFSTDNTYSIVQSVIKLNSNDDIRIKLISSENKNYKIAGKKFAIRAGIKASSGQIIITSDADCKFGMDWIAIISDYFLNNDVQLLTGPVVFATNKNFFQKLQSLEFLSLIASAAGFISVGLPILGNASNMSFRRTAFLKSEELRNDYNHSSGDDIFLIHAINKYYGPKSVSFIKNMSAIVYTRPMEDINSFLCQRIRWVSKSKKYNDFTITAVAWVTFLFNFMILSVLVVSVFFDLSLFYFTAAVLVLKTLIELPVFVGITTFTRKVKHLHYIIPLEVINMFYVVTIAFAGYFRKVKWKGKDIY